MGEGLGLGHASSQVATGVYEHLLYDGILDDALDVFSLRRAQHVAQHSEAEPETGANLLN
jgi:hypothetical protein